MRYAYFPGCSLHSTAKEYDLSAHSVCRKLSIDLVEIPDWICCGASTAHTTNELLDISLPIRSLVWAEHEGIDVTVPCSECFSRLKSANVTVQQDGHLREKIARIIGEPYNGSIRVYHLLQTLADEKGLEAIKNTISKKLTGLHAAAYYGCLLVRPPKIAQLDDPENPQIMDNLINALGAEAISWPYKTECCGASFSLTKKEIVLKLSHDILSMAKEFGAECIIVACPLCQSNLDLRQRQIERKYKTKLNLPILYFTQLIGLALGLDVKALGLKKLIVSPMKLLMEKDLI